jgi:hypothetical protein
MTPQPTPQDPRALVRALNEAALARTLGEFPAILIRPADLPSWRPCDRTYVGTVVGMEHLGTLVPLCTDGVVAWFSVRPPDYASLFRIGAPAKPSTLTTNAALPQGVEDVGVLQPSSFVFHAHVSHFQWLGGGGGAPPQPYREEKPKATKGKGTSTKTALSRALELLIGLE